MHVHTGMPIIYGYNEPLTAHTRTYLKYICICHTYILTAQLLRENVEWKWNGGKVQVASPCIAVEKHI